MRTAARTLVVWCPDWPITAAGIDAATPAAVFHANRVVACSAAARADGVRRSMRRREAQARCPELIVLAHDLSRDARAFEVVVAAVESFTPGVEVLRPGACAVATRGPSRYFGGDDALAEKVAAAAAIAVPQTTCHAGIADGVFAATLAARQHPAGIVVERGRSAAFLAPFPIATFEAVLPRSTPLGRGELVDLLKRLGIRTLGDLSALPASDIVARFGLDGARVHRLARGEDERLVDGRVPPPDLTAALELDPPVERLDAVSFAAKALADDLHRRLAARGLACTRIRIEAETDHGESLSRVWRHQGPLTPSAMAERVRWQIDGWLAGSAVARPTAGLILLRLVPEEVGADDGRQQGFWGSETAGAERAARGLARVQGLLGPDAVLTPVLGGGRDPAARVRLVPWGDPRDADPLAGCPWPGQVPSPSPATVLDAPLPAEVADAQGRPVTVTGRAAVSAPPARVAVSGRRAASVTGWAGPWPVDERWWDPPVHRRRARFQVALDTGIAYLLTLEGGTWSVEAIYD